MDLEISRAINIFKHYEIEYDKKYKLIIIRKPIPVKDFVFLKYVLNDYKYKIDDIRVI